MRDALFLQRATLPSKKSKNSPKGINAKAAHILVRSDEAPRQYRIDERIDMSPQKPRSISECRFRRLCDGHCL